MNQLHGEWHATAATLGGADQPAQDLVLKINGNDYEVVMNGLSIDKGTASLQLGGKMEIASQAPGGPRLLAIYKISGDSLTVCYDLSGKDWPTAFESKPGSQHYLVVYKKKTQPESIKKVVLVYGLIAGAIVAAMMFITMPMYKNGSLNLDNGEYVGYTTMVIALSMVFIGIKSYRDNYLSGIITFGKGVKVGLLITLIASIMYAFAWEICYSNFYPDFMDKMTEHYFEKMKQGGKTEAQIEEAKKSWAGFTEMYANPVIRFGVTLMEIMPVGIIITLLSAGLLRKKEFLAATS